MSMCRSCYSHIVLFFVTNGALIIMSSHSRRNAVIHWRYMLAVFVSGKYVYLAIQCSALWFPRVAIVPSLSVI